jgi:hypothetical protein
MSFSTMSSVVYRPPASYQNVYGIILPGVKGHWHDEVDHSSSLSAGDKVNGIILAFLRVASRSGT